jgi:hypothetical protein
MTMAGEMSKVQISSIDIKDFMMSLHCYYFDERPSRAKFYVQANDLSA